MPTFNADIAKQIDYKKAKLYFEKSIDLYKSATGNDYEGDLSSFFYLGVIYNYGKGGIKKDLKKAFDYYQKGAKLGEESAMFALAESYR
jgi:TPR repeat protein